MSLLQKRGVLELIRRALEEDVGMGDVTTNALVPPGLQVEAVILARQPVVVCGGEVAVAVFHEVDSSLAFELSVADGGSAPADATLLTVRGRARSILTAERTALNFMQRMTGIATLTRQFVEQVASHGTTILDTRKTTPTLRVFEKYAVCCGGGENHRFGLFDRVLIKDNHRRLAGRGGSLPLDLAIQEARRCTPGLTLEVEVESLDELEVVLRAAPDWVLLDNMSLDAMAACVRRVNGACKTEASGGITLARAAAVAATGVDAISLGCLTHSPPAADLSLEIVDPGPA